VRWAIPGSGTSGIRGFTCPDVIEKQHFSRFTHSTQLVSRIHCEIYWLPFLRQEKTKDVRNLCERCLSNECNIRRAAQNEFHRLYDAAVGGALRQAFPERWGTALSDLHVAACRFIMRSGRDGLHTFDELLHCTVRVLRHHV
jgi:hypothetical protein